MTETNLYPTLKEKIQLEITRLRNLKIQLYNLRDEKQEQLKIAKKNNQDTGVLLVQIEDINNRIKGINERLSQIIQGLSYFDY